MNINVHQRHGQQDNIQNEFFQTKMYFGIKVQTDKIQHFLSNQKRIKQEFTLVFGSVKIRLFQNFRQNTQENLKLYFNTLCISLLWYLGMIATI